MPLSCVLTVYVFLFFLQKLGSMLECFFVFQFFEPSGIFGYDCTTGVCDYISNENSFNPAMFSLLVGMTLPIFMAIVSYSYIGWYFFSCYRHLKADY